MGKQATHPVTIPLSESLHKFAQQHLNMTQIFIIPDHHHTSHQVKTFSVKRHPEP